jgi:hypothetical protein
MPELNKLEQRKRLHRAIDLIFDGPAVGKEWIWAKEVTLGFSEFIGAAGRALDIIAGEALAPVAVPPEAIRAYRIGDRHLAVRLKLNDRWEEIGRKARNVGLSDEERRRVAIALLRTISPAHPILEEMSDAVDALPFGEVKAILKPSSKGFHGIGHGRSAWDLRLKGLQCAEYLIRAGIMRKTDAIEAVAEAFNLTVQAVRGWYEQAAAETHFGIQHVEARVCVARSAGFWLKRCAQENANLPGDKQLHEPNAFEPIFGLEALRDYGRKFQQLPRKLRNKK